MNHHTYNIGSGRATSNQDVIAALHQAVHDFTFTLPPGGGDHPRWLDITRLRQDTGYEPDYDPPRAAADYVAWLRQGHMT